MDINKLIANIKKKIEKNVPLDYIKIEDKSFIHKNHPGNKEGKCHLKILIKSSSVFSPGLLPTISISSEITLAKSNIFTHFIL